MALRRSHTRTALFVLPPPAVVTPVTSPSPSGEVASERETSDAYRFRGSHAVSIAESRPC